MWPFKRKATQPHPYEEIRNQIRRGIPVSINDALNAIGASDDDAAPDDDLLKELVASCKEIHDIVMEPNTMDSSRWYTLQKQVALRLRAAIAQAEESES